MDCPIIINNKSLKKKDLIDNVNEIMKIPIKRICIFFANHDYENRAENDPNPPNKIYKKQAFHQHRLTGYGAPNSFIPRSMPLEIQTNLRKRYGFDYENLFDHFIWLSKKICQAEDIYFVFVYS